jgi:hypothetical protein
MIVGISFCKMYEPGELAPPQFQEESYGEFDLQAIPRYKDQIKFKDKHYFVLDVVYDLNNSPSVDIKAVRRIQHAWEVE